MSIKQILLGGVFAVFLSWGSAAADPEAFKYMDASEIAEFRDLALQIGMSPDDMFEGGFSLTVEAEAKIAALDSGTNTSGNAGEIAELQADLDEHIATMTARGQGPNPAVVAAIEKSMAYYGGKPKLATPLSPKTAAASSKSLPTPSKPQEETLRPDLELATEADMRAAIGKIRPENRVVGMVTENASGDGFPTQLILLADGTATRCWSLDPSRPRAEQTHLNANCWDLKWKKAGDYYAFSSKSNPGVKFDSRGTDSAKPFKAGARVDRAARSTDIGGRIGLDNVHVAKEGYLKIYPDGRINLTGGAWVMVEMKAHNENSGMRESIGGLNGMRSSVGMQGRYYLDGYVLVYAPDYGGIEYGYVHWNGDWRNGIPENFYLNSACYCL